MTIPRVISGNIINEGTPILLLKLNVWNSGGMFNLSAPLSVGSRPFQGSVSTCAEGPPA